MKGMHLIIIHKIYVSFHAVPNSFAIFLYAASHFVCWECFPSRRLYGRLRERAVSGINAMESQGKFKFLLSRTFLHWYSISSHNNLRTI